MSQVLPIDRILQAWVVDFSEKFAEQVTQVFMTWIESDESLTITALIRLKSSFLLTGTVEQVTKDLSIFPELPGYIPTAVRGQQQAFGMLIAVPNARAATLVFMFPLRARSMTSPNTWNKFNRGLIIYPKPEQAAMSEKQILADPTVM